MKRWSRSGNHPEKHLEGPRWPWWTLEMVLPVLRGQEEDKTCGWRFCGQMRADMKNHSEDILTLCFYSEKWGLTLFLTSSWSRQLATGSGSGSGGASLLVKVSGCFGHYLSKVPPDEWNSAVLVILQVFYVYFCCGSDEDDDEDEGLSILSL